MNSANETLRSIRHRKAITTKKYERALKRCKNEETIAKINMKYDEDMNILNKEETELLKQFKDIPKEAIKK